MRDPLHESGGIDMSVFRIATTAVVALLLVSLPACVPSDNPLVEPQKCTFDERLVGIWKLVDKESVTYAIIGRPRDVTNRPDGLMVIHTSTFHPDSEIEHSDKPTYFFSVKAGANHYLQMPHLKGADKITEWDAKNIQSFQFIRCEFFNDRVVLYLMNKDAVKQLIADGKLKGTIKKNKGILGPEVRITESTDGLLRLLAKDGAKALFPEETKITLIRVK
jgi:hypothetical protein